MRKGIILGIGIIIVLLALIGTVSARPDGSFGTSCGSCHTGYSAPITPDQLTSKGNFFNSTHRYDDFTLTPPACVNCHVSVSTGDFGLLNGTPTYLNSYTCKNCHKKKYDNWYGTLHRVMLSNNTSAALMNLPVPGGLNWSTTNVTYMVVGKTSFRYLNETGYFFSQYNVIYQNFSSYGPSKYTCGSCHTTGYNATGGNQSGLVGIVGTWSEEGIACENCHGPGGTGHNVTVDSTGQVCLRCHNGSTRQGAALTSPHFRPPVSETGAECIHCHSPYDKYQNRVPTPSTEVNVTCSVCHNPHNPSDEKYSEILSPGGFNADSMADAPEVRLSFFNGTASNDSRSLNLNESLTAGNDVYDNLTAPALLYPGVDPSRKDSSYGTSPIDVIGPVSEVLCSTCHYRHGLAHIAGVNLTHGRNSVNRSEWATCADCHMARAGNITAHSFDARDPDNYPQNTCSKGTECHVTSDQNQSLSDGSIVPVETEWSESLHNDKVNGGFYNNGTAYQNASCSKCHSPFNWNPLNQSDTVNASEFKGIICTVCHNIHNMGDWINNTGKVYAWYNRDAIPVLNDTEDIIDYQANYTEMPNTTELCGNCHDNLRLGRTGPGWASAASTTPISPHGFPAKDIFTGSWKQTSLLNFECVDCHMYIKKTDDTGAVLNDTEKITGHSLDVNETGLENTTRCSGCHVNGTSVGTIENVIDTIQASTNDKWNNTNTIVLSALANYQNYNGSKNVSRDKIAQAYWNLKEVSSDSSWGVHNPVKVNQLLDDASRLANESNASLGLTSEIVSRVQLKAGWNLVALNGTPAVTSAASVLASISSNITVVWGYNETSAEWELYDPAMPSVLNTLKDIIPGKGYWINAVRDCEWTV